MFVSDPMESGTVPKKELLKIWSTIKLSIAPMLSGMVPTRPFSPMVIREMILLSHATPSQEHTSIRGISFTQDQPLVSWFFVVKAAAKSHIARSAPVAVGAVVGAVVGAAVGDAVGVAVVGASVGCDGWLLG